MGRTRFCIRDPYFSACVPKQAAKLTTARAGPEVGTGELDNGAGVRVDERLEPRAGLVVLDLNDVREGERAVLLRDELERRWVLVKLARQCALCLRDRVVERDGGSRRRNRRYEDQ